MDSDSKDVFTWARRTWLNPKSTAEDTAKLSSIQRSIHLLVVGSASAGKTTIINQILGKRDTGSGQKMRPTLGIDYQHRTRSAQNLTLHVWEFGGGLRFSSLMDIVVPHIVDDPVAEIRILYVFDLTNPIESLHCLYKLLPQFANLLPQRISGFFLLGSKYDQHQDDDTGRHVVADCIRFHSLFFMKSVGASLMSQKERSLECSNAPVLYAGFGLRSPRTMIVDWAVGGSAALIESKSQNSDIRRGPLFTVNDESARSIQPPSAMALSSSTSTDADPMFVQWRSVLQECKYPDNLSAEGSGTQNSAVQTALRSSKFREPQIDELREKLRKDLEQWRRSRVTKIGASEEQSQSATEL